MKSIRLKLWTGMMILVVIMLILLWFFQIVFLESFYTSMRVSEIKRTGYSIIKELEKLNPPDIRDKLDAFSYNNHLTVEVLNTKGNVIYESSAAEFSGRAPMMRNKARHEAFGDVLQNKEVTIQLIHPRFGNKFMLIGLPIKISGQIQGALFINMPLAPVKDTAAILKKQLIYITGILLAAALIISFLISKTFTKPILEIKKVSEKMASGDFSDRIESKSKDEIGKLSETINYMGEELAKIEQLRKDLIANVSHDLRTPLSLIQGYAETIRDVSGDTREKREKHVEIIIEESERLSRIVDDMLNLSQIQAGYMSLNISSFYINNLIERIVKRYDILSKKTDITISSKSTGDLKIMADETRIGQVLYNLINNAFNNTNKGGSIVVNSFDEDNFVRIEVTDTGIGIPEEDIKHIWDRYYKTDKTSGKKVVGTGLGLAIVKNILEAHSALYGVESKEGVGTTFWFQLEK